MKIILLAISILFVSVNADAVCLNGNPSVKHEYDDGPIVLVGKVTAKKAVAESRDYYEGDEYTVQAQEIFKGVPPNPLLIFSENSSGRFPMEVGSTYLLFIHEEMNRYQVSNCGNSGLLSKEKDTLNEIKLLIDLSSPEATLAGYIESLRQGNVKGVLDRYDGIKEFQLSRPIPIDKYQIVKKITYGKKEVTSWNDKGIRPAAAIGDVELQVNEWINGKEQLYSYNFRLFNRSWKMISHSAWGVD